MENKLIKLNAPCIMEVKDTSLEFMLTVASDHLAHCIIKLYNTYGDIFSKSTSEMYKLFLSQCHATKLSIQERMIQCQVTDTSECSLDRVKSHLTQQLQSQEVLSLADEDAPKQIHAVESKAASDSAIYQDLVVAERIKNFFGASKFPCINIIIFKVANIEYMTYDLI